MKKLFCAVMLIAVMMAGCANGSTPAPAPAPEAAPAEQTQPDAAPAETGSENVMKTQIMFNGSSTLAPVIASIAASFNEEYVTWDKVNPSFPAENISIYVSSGGSGQGMKAVIDQTTDFGMLARTVKDSEKEQLPNMQEYLVGIDALTIAVNPANPICQIKDNFTKEEIVKLFSGEYETWQDLDPSLPAEEIIVVIRDIGGGAHEVFQNNIMGDAEVKATAIQSPSMGALVAKVIENKNAIGYASFGVSNQNAGSLVQFKVDGVEPSAENIVNGSYIIQRPLLAVFDGEPTEIQKAFLDVVLGPQGQDVVSSMGFIPAK